MTAWEGLNPPYRTIVVDPPWPVSAANGHGKGGRRARSTPAPYSTMSMTAIERLSIAGSELAAYPSALFLWITPKLNREGWGPLLADEWGFNISGEIVWDKPNLGMGLIPRTSHEILLVCNRGGTGAFRADAPRNIHSVQRWRQEYGNNGGKSHSAKPGAAYDLIESISPGPYVELFARQPRLGWDHWGYGFESEKSASVGAEKP